MAGNRRQYRRGFQFYQLFIIAFLLTAYSLLLVSGCARTVTQIAPSGAEMVVQVTMRGTVEATANRYFLVVSGTSAYKVQLPLPQPGGTRDELLEPGTIPMYGSMEAYFNNYYSTWTGYVITEPAGYFLGQGPFVFGASSTREVLSTTAPSGSFFNFTIRLEQLFGANVPDIIYFDILTVPWVTGAEKLPADHLMMSNYVSKIAGTELTINDDPDSSVPSSLDLNKVVVKIQ
jgi:hypothetical protein